MIKLKYQVTNDCGAVAGPFETQFPNRDVMRRWMSLQNRHPWLVIETVEVVDTDKTPHVFAIGEIVHDRKHPDVYGKIISTEGNSIEVFWINRVEDNSSYSVERANKNLNVGRNIT